MSHLIMIFFICAPCTQLVYMQNIVRLHNVLHKVCVTFPTVFLPLCTVHAHTHIYMYVCGIKVLSSIRCLASLSTGGRQLVPCAADWKARIPKVSCTPNKQTWTTGLDVFSSTRSSSQPDKHKSETAPVRTFKPLSTIWFWAYPRGANPTRLGRTGW